MSGNTILSSTSNVPSLDWTSSEPSNPRSDAASIRSQSTWPETVMSDFRSIHDSEVTKIPERTWRDSPAAIASPFSPHDHIAQPLQPLVVPAGKKYQCPMCFLDNNPVGFGRKSDFKKHLHNFHGADVVWICPTKSCQLSYATERGYGTHAKETHRAEAHSHGAARTELCPQLVFSCGFPDCKDRVFEAPTYDDASASRDKYFEHIAKHFEDDFDVNRWQYATLIQNLLRQQKVKATFKTCIWPKEARQQLRWQPRSSGNLKRLLECRHLGSDIPALVRLAYILGQSPFSLSKTPPGGMDLHFPHPIRTSCQLDTPDHPSGLEIKAEDFPTPTDTKRRPSVPQVVLNSITSFKSKRDTRPSTPAGIPSEVVKRSAVVAGPHPGTPIHIPEPASLPLDAPIFAPEAATFPVKETHDAMDVHIVTSLPDSDSPYHSWVNMDPTASYALDNDVGMLGNEFYRYTLNSNQMSHAARPATPAPQKRPASWSKRMSLENIRPKKKATPLNSPAGVSAVGAGHTGITLGGVSPSVPMLNSYADVIPTSLPTHYPTHAGVAGYAIPTRMSHDHYISQHSQPLLDDHHVSHMMQGQPQGMDLSHPSQQTFYFDDGEMGAL